MFQNLRKKIKQQRLYSNSLSGERSKTFRILTILPGTWASPVKCYLDEARLQDKNAYIALSYSWKTKDDDNNLHLITCNRVTVSVSRNLHSALQRLRQYHDAVQIWVDFVCINQEDDSERSCQVSMMRDIYAQSTEVVIWLGESGSQDHLGELIEPKLGTHDLSSLYQWYGDERDLPKLTAYVSLQYGNDQKTALDEQRIDIFGVFYVLSALISGVEASGIQSLRHLDKSGPILRGFDALIQLRWVSLCLDLIS